MDKIAVLIPCYNEGKTIGKVVSDFKKILPEAAVYVYDNNSSDDTAQIAKDHGAIVRHEYQQGKGNVIRRMFRDIDAECYIITDGDDTYPAETAKEMADAVFLRDIDMVIGDRLSSTYFTENKRSFHNFGNLLVRKSINTYSDGLKVLRTIIRLYRTYRPIGFFGMIALLMALIAAVFFIPIVHTYLRTGSVPNFPTLIVCGFTMIASIQSLFTGLTLQTMVQKNRQDFEMDLHRVSENKRKR